MNAKGSVSRFTSGGFLHLFPGFHAGLVASMRALRLYIGIGCTTLPHLHNCPASEDKQHGIGKHSWSDGRSYEGHYTKLGSMAVQVVPDYAEDDDC